MTAVQPGPAKKKVAATVAERPALWLWRFCSPHEQPGAAAQPQPAREGKKKNTPPEPKKKTYLVSGIRVHSCAHLKLFIS